LFWGNIYYLSETQHNKVTYNGIQRIAEDAYVWMDRFTIRNLELYSYNPNAVTLLDVIDKRFRQWVGVC
jgi:DNA mismatch repair protein MutS